LSQTDKQKFITNVTYTAIIIALGYLVIQYLAVWMMPFIVGLVLALILQHPVGWVVNHSRLKRKFVAPVVTLVLVAMIVSLLTLLMLLAVGEAAVFAASLPVWFQNTAPNIIDAISQRLESIIKTLPHEWETQIREIVYDGLKMLQSQIGSMSTTVLSWMANWAASLPSVLISFIITLVATFFLCSDFDKVKGFFWRQVPGKYKELAGDTWVTFAQTIGQMLKSYILIMFITFCQLAIGLTLLRVEYSVLLAAIISVLDIMPVIGTGTILIPWGLIALATNNTPLGIGILLLYVVITVVRNILEPKIIGKRIGLHPLVTLSFMYLGLHILGIPGLFLFPIIFIMLKKAQEAGMIRLWKD